MFIAMEVLMLPMLVPEDVYTTFEYYKSLIFMFPFVLFGSYSGFMYTKYTKGSDDFESLMLIGLCLSVVCAIIFSLVMKTMWILIPLLLINLFTMAEQKLKVDKRFVAAFLFKPLLSIIVLIIATIYYYLPGARSLSTWHLLNGGFIVAFTIWMFLGRSSFRFSGSTFSFSIHKEKYLILVKKGFPIATGSILLSLLFFSDRYMIANYYEEHLATYSFGFNLSQMLVMALSTIAYVSAVDLGEKKNTLSKEYLRKIFLRGLGLYGILILMMVPALMIIREFYTYDDLLSICLLLTYSKGLYFLLTTVSAVILYFDYQWNACLALLLAVIFNLAILTLVQQLGYSVFILLLTSSVSLLAYSAYTYYLIFVKIDYKENLLNS